MSVTRGTARAYEYRPYRRGDESRIVAILSRCLSSWRGRDVAAWIWEHPERPGFTPDEVLTVNYGGTMVACFHGAILPLRLADDLVLPVSLDEDFAVFPEHRGGDIAGVRITWRTCGCSSRGWYCAVDTPRKNSTNDSMAAATATPSFPRRGSTIVRR
jgi:hypothetical protein